MKSKHILYKTIPVFAAIIILMFISYFHSGYNAAANSGSDTVQSLENIFSNKTIFRSPSGKHYEVTLDFSQESGPEMSDAALDCSNDNFHGSDRKKAKTSIAQIGTDTYSGLNEFLNSLPDDDEMKNHNPPISKSETSNRVFEEKRNAKILNTFIYAIKREHDNDLHIITGNVPDDHVYFNMENSGLPGKKSKFYKKLKAVRKKFEDQFGELCSTAYLKFNPPIPITIKGSLFYDIDHSPGTVGPSGLRPETAWEIHPVTDVVFEN